MYKKTKAAVMAAFVVYSHETLLANLVIIHATVVKF